MIDVERGLQMFQVVKREICESRLEHVSLDEEPSDRWFECFTSDDCQYSKVAARIDVEKTVNRWSKRGSSRWKSWCLQGLKIIPSPLKMQTYWRRRMEEGQKRCKLTYSNTLQNCKGPTHWLKSEIRCLILSKNFHLFQQVTTDGIPFMNIARDARVLRYTKFRRKNILNESDSGYGDKHAEQEEPENELELIPSMNRANSHEQ